MKRSRRAKAPNQYGETLVARGNWPAPEGVRTVGAKILTRKKRWSFDVRYHSKRRHSKKFRSRR